MRIQRVAPALLRRLGQGAGSVLSDVGRGGNRLRRSCAAGCAAGTCGRSGSHVLKVRPAGAGRLSDKDANAAMRFLPALLLAMAPALLWAQESDPLKSAACGDALAALQAARAGDGTDAAAQALRSSAARTCLGGTGVAGRPARVLQAPIVV